MKNSEWVLIYTSAKQAAKALLANVPAKEISVWVPECAIENSKQMPKVAAIARLWKDALFKEEGKIRVSALDLKD